MRVGVLESGTDEVVGGLTRGTKVRIGGECVCT